MPVTAPAFLISKQSIDNLGLSQLTNKNKKGLATQKMNGEFA